MVKILQFRGSHNTTEVKRKVSKQVFALAGDVDELKEHITKLGELLGEHCFAYHSEAEDDSAESCAIIELCQTANSALDSFKRVHTATIEVATAS